MTKTFLDRNLPNIVGRPKQALSIRAKSNVGYEPHDYLSAKAAHAGGDHNTRTLLLRPPEFI